MPLERLEKLIDEIARYHREYPLDRRSEQELMEVIDSLFQHGDSVTTEISGTN